MIFYKWVVSVYVETIFVQIASYRDPELPATISDCIRKAKYPERLRFGICWQKTEDEQIDKYIHDQRFRVHSVHWSESKGVGWARHICNSLYQYEDFTLQIDSHHRFIPNWDVELINMWKSCNHKKAVISGYPPGYDIIDNTEVFYNLPPMSMVIKGFDYGFVPTFKSWYIHNTELITKPIRGCFIAAGFVFTLGKVCEDVPYMEDIYFTGEEIIYSLRLFTHGYRVFYPNLWVLWHRYERKTSERHWVNFISESQLKSSFDELQNKSINSLRSILSGDMSYKKYLGNVNTITDFENYCGVSFKHKVIHPDAIKGYEPPYATHESWVNEVKPLKEYKCNFNITIKDIPNRDDYDFWYFGIHDDECNELYRKDICDNFDGISIYSDTLILRDIPTKYIIWPHIKSGEWLERLVYDIPKGGVIQL